MATVDILSRDQAVDMPFLATRSRRLAMLQIAQIGTGFLGQALLLMRWSPNAYTDLFLLMSSVPWLIAAGVLIGGLEMMLPSVYHDVLAKQGPVQADQFLQQITLFIFIIGLVGTVISAFIVSLWAWQSDISLILSLWMGTILGSQVLTFGLGSLWRGLLIAHDRLIRLRLTVLAGSVLTVVGYAVLPSEPILFLPTIAAAATLLASYLAWQSTRDVIPSFTLQIPQTLHPKLKILGKSLVALGFAAGFVHLQAIVERAALWRLETGMVTAFTVAGRGWEAILAIVVAAAIMPVYPHWAGHTSDSQNPLLLRWSLIRATVLSAILGFIVGCVALIGLSALNGNEWQSWRQTLQLVLALLPRSMLLATLQPLILKHFAQGKPYLPVFGSLLGLGVVTIGALTVMPRFGVVGIALATAASVLPGWIILVWYEWRIS